MPRQDQEEVSFLRTDDYVCLSCVAHGQSDRTERLCLAAGGFGNRMCFFENVSFSDQPADLSVGVFVLEQALSVRALQEMVSTNQTEGSAQSGHRTLLYGHAILLRHLQSYMYLACLSTSSSTDKLAFDVGLQENANTESCWWTIHPASKQRSEGEKVRIGDDLILVSVSSERYLHLTTNPSFEHSVQASFQQTLWGVIPVSSGTARQKALGMVLGGDVLRLFHGDECLTVPITESDGSPATGSMHQHNYELDKDLLSDNGEGTSSAVMYEMGAVSTHARSLWRLEHIRLKWSGGFISWRSACRLRHVTSGRYLALQGNDLVVVHRTEASEEACAFVVLQSKDDKVGREERDDEGMGTPDLKFGESMAFMQHRATGRWLSYQTFETKKRGLGKVEEKRAVLLAEGHMDDGMTMTRAQDEESNAAVAIRRCASLFTRYIKGLEALQVEGPRSLTWSRISLAEVLRCLEDLIAFFVQPSPADDHDTRQEKLKALRNRQDLFQEEGMIGLILTTINAQTSGKFASKREFVQAVGEDRADYCDQLGNNLYLLLAAMIRGNQANCAQFAHSSRLDWLFNRLESQQSAEGVLDALHCVLTDSHEALNMIREEHIQTLIRLLDKQGRGPKVLKVLCSLCAGLRSGAVRVNQDLICDNLLAERDLLLQTRLVDYTRSMRPNIFVGLSEGGAIYKRWYFEVVIDSLETVTNNAAKLRIGWGNTDGFTPHPGGGQGWGALSLGDDLFSFAFDGQCLWSGGKPKRVCNIQQRLKRGDVIGCFLDLSVPRIGFSVNGNAVKGFFQNFNTSGMFFPCVSMSAKVSVRFVFGGTQGKLKFGPPDGHAPMAEALMPRDRLKIEACFNLGTPEKGILCGPTEPRELAVFIPTPVDTSHVQMNENIEAVRDKLAVNLHELWAMRKVEQGWTFSERRDDHKRRHPCLTSFDRLPSSERHYNVTLAFETLRTIMALGYHISYEPIPGKEGTQPRVIKLNNNYLQPNSYKPAPLELSSITLNERLEELVDSLAENTHNVWARDRIRQGWTYGASEDIHNKRSPHLVPYNKVDDFIKQSNRVTAGETVKTLLAYNYSIESPVTDNLDVGRNRKSTKTKLLTRTFRVQNTWAVSDGKWYYEAEVLSSGHVRLGWAQSTCPPNVAVGADSRSYAFECSHARKWHQESASYGKVCQPGDVIGCVLDLQDRTVAYSLNGELMMDPLGQEIAFKDVEVGEDLKYVPAFSLDSGQQVRVNFGNDVHSLKYFTCCGLQEGFQPYCVNMSRPSPLWYSREDASLFRDVTSLHPTVEVIRTTDSTPTLKFISKTYGNIQRDEMDFLRLSLPVKCKDHFITRSIAERRNELETLHRQLLPPQSSKISGGHLTPSEDYMIKTHPTSKRHAPASVSQNDLVNGHGSTAGGSLLEIPDKRGSSKRSKSPFSLFKKVGRSRETSPEPTHGRTPRGGLRTGNRSGVQRSVEVEPPNANDIKIYSQYSDGDEHAELAADLMARENALAEHMEEYCFSVRVLPGQEPNAVYVGWVSSNFKLTNVQQGSCPEVRQAVVCQLDVDYRPKPGCSEKSAYIMNAGELLARYGVPEDASKRMSQGLLVTCWLDAASGALGFDLNGREVANKFQVEPLTRLYPAVFARPTAREMVVMEFSRTRHSLSVLSAMTRSPKLAQPHLHPRLTVQYLERSYWARVPDAQLRVHTLKLSEVRGWSMLCEEPIQMLAVHIPEQDRCVDVLELEENPDLLNFHAHSLELYRSVCCRGNHRVAHILTTHVDDKQLMHTIQSINLAGPIRMGFFNLLIAMHLESHKQLMELTQQEFVLPLSSEEGSERRHGKRPSIFDVSEEEATVLFHKIPSVESFRSARPALLLDPAVTKELGMPVSDEQPSGVTQHMLGTPPPFPLARLRDTCIRFLRSAVNLGSHIRDPIGGSNAYLFVPLLRVADTLLVMGLFSAKDMEQLLSILDPKTFPCHHSSECEVFGSLLSMPLEEDVKLELCHLLHHLTDLQLRHQIETLVDFANKFCLEVQNDQLRRYLDIKQSNLPSSVTARKTREFRCPPNEQMRSMVTFHRDINGEVSSDAVDSCPSRDDLKQVIMQHHEMLMKNCGVEREEEEKSDMTEMQGLSGSRELIPLEGGLAIYAPRGGPLGDPETGPGLLGRRNIFKRLLELVWKKPAVVEVESVIEEERTLATLVVQTIVSWARETFIENLDLVRDMFSLLHRQFDTLGQITAALDKTYVISESSQYHLNKMMRALGTVRLLLGVEVGPTEEEALKACLWEIMDNKVFFQHPNLIRCLAVHETVMQLMVHTLTKTSLDSSSATDGAESGKGVDEGAADMVVMCCRFLCYFCRTSGDNQKAMFEHLSYMLENSSMLLARPSLRGSCPLDVAYSSLMDNNELALMLRESQLEKVAVYLSRCGVQSNAELLIKGYPDIGWDPVEGERFLDFLRFTVWVNGESVEENANLVVRLLIRRPECLGPALRGGADQSSSTESGGLLKAMKEGIVMSAQIALANDEDGTLTRLLADYEDAHVFSESPFDFGGLPPEDDEDYIDLGAAVLTFYSVLVDLLGRCAPENDTTKPDSVRVQAILRSLVSLADLEGVISLCFILLPSRMENVVNEEGESEVKDVTGLPPGLLPEHKAAVVLFLERVYGITEAATFLRLLENGFLPDMRTATVLETMGNAGETDMALALNRYLCNSVLPLLTKHAHFLAEDVEQAGDLIDATLHTTYRLSKCNSLTKGQRDIVSEFLVSLTKQLQPHMMTRLLRKLAYDVPSLSPQSVVPLRLLTVYYERCGRYFGTGGWSGHGCASEEERHLTMILFTRIFDSLALRPYDPELFSIALPCLCAIGCALSPDYSSTDHGRLSTRVRQPAEKTEGSHDSVFVPLPAETSRVSIGPDLAKVVDHFAQHYHDSWALEVIEQGWTFGNTLDGGRMTQPNLRPYHMLQTRDQIKYSEPIQECLKAMVAWGWRIEREDPMAGESRIADRRRPTVIMESPHGYTPTPRDLRNISLTRDVLTMSEKLAENAHNCWAKRKQEDLEDLGGAAHHQLVPYDILTEREKNKYRKLALELLKYLQTEGFRVSSSHLTNADDIEGVDSDSNAPSNAGAAIGGGGSFRSTERRFAYRLLVKLLEYMERVVVCVKQSRPSDRYARSRSFAQEPEDMKFFGKVVLPLVEKYFDAHKHYFVGPHTLATSKEKEYVTSLFCKLFSLLRQKMLAFGHDVNISVRCLQGLVHAIDFRALVKNQSVVRVFLLPFFGYCADDLAQVVHNLKLERFSHVKGTIQRGATSLNYIYMVLLPVLKGIFEHLGATLSGDELLVGDIQVACYRILNGLYVLGTCNSQSLGREQLADEFERHRPLLGECVAAFASTFPVAFLEPRFNAFNKYSINYGIQGDLGEHSLEAREVMTELSKSLPELEKIVDEIADLAESGGNYDEAPHVIEVTLPMLCSYLPFWWARGSENEETTITSVTTTQMNSVLGNVLKLVRNNIESIHAPWMTRIATRTQPIVANAPDDMLGQHFLPVAIKLQQAAVAVEHEDEAYQAEKRSGLSSDIGEAEERLQAKVEMLVRNMFAFYPLLIRYVDRHRTSWIKQPTVETGQLFSAVASMFLIWSKSSVLKRAEQNFVCQNEIDHLALIMPGQSSSTGSAKSSSDSNSSKASDKGSKQTPNKKKLENFTSLNVACIKRLLPIGLSLFGGREQELVQKAKQKLINKENEAEIEEYLRTVMEEDEDSNNLSNKWQKVLYKKIGQAKLAGVVDQLTRQNLVDKVINLAKVLHALYLVDHPPSASKSAWKKLISSQRKRAVMACFRMLPIHALPRHKVVNLFIESYKDVWLANEESPDVKLIEVLTSEDEMDVDDGGVGGGVGSGGPPAAEAEAASGQAGLGLIEAKPDPLKQLITALSRSAETQAEDDPLYMSYANIMGKSCSGEDDDDDDDGGDEDAGVSFQEQEMAKQQLLAEQGRLANRGAAEMILLEISACKGEVTDVVQCTIELGIALLLGGNVDVQEKMLNYLKEKKDVGFFTSMAGLMQQCSVLDLDAFERSNKAEGLGVSDATTGNTNLSDAEFTCKLFRFLQLLAEGHNLAFQDYLRSQAGNTTTVNIIICTVDYLLRLQESIMDFYWHYSGKDKIDEAGKKHFCRAIKVGKQIFATLTEDIQGPCVGNQLALAHSRLWDAISGFLYIFANMQEKLSKDPDQLELLREFMNLQKEMMIMLLSMLEGNVVNGPIGKQMVDTLVESSANVEMILKFFDIFLRMKDITSSEAFLAFDVNGDGWISHKEFRSAMVSQKMYSEEEIEYIMMCVDANHDGKVDFNEFTERFHNPAKDIGFNLAVLLTNLSEHMPNDPRLERLISKAKRVLDTFEPYLGRIEIMGSNGRIERVYFEIRQSPLDQWQQPQIKESKRSFLHSIVNEGGDKEKLESFTNFCVDSIFEMQHAQAISGDGEGLKVSQVAAVRRFLDSNHIQLASRAITVVRNKLAYLTPSNLKHGWGRFREMTPAELVLTLGRGQLNIVIMILSLLWFLTRSIGSVIGAMMRGDPDGDKAWEPQITLQEQQPWLMSEEQQLAIEHLDTTELALLDEHYHATAGHQEAHTHPGSLVSTCNGVRKPDISQETKSSSPPRTLAVLGARTPPRTPTTLSSGREETSEPVTTTSAAEGDDEEVPVEAKTIDTSTYVLSLFARNFYQFKICALVLAFVINFTLLFYRVSQTSEGIADAAQAVVNATTNATEGGGGGGGGDDDVEEWVSLPDSASYCQTLLRIIALLHSAMSFSMLVAYCCLKVPLVIFKREKEVSRQLEFDGMWISEQPSEDDIRGLWDKLVLSTQSFPQMYWDKFVKKKVRAKYSEQYDDEEIVALLGIQETGPESKDTPQRSFIPQWFADMDLRYQLWKWGVIFTDNSFLYLVMYFVASVIGNYNYFFFACHLLDVAIGFKTLRTILQSVTHNGKQLVLTVILTSIIIYLYTVIAFNFFRKFYIKDNDGVKDAKCHDMLTCFVFHLHTGLRAGGGIGDEIESPDGDPYEVYRILFDMTFFFFVIVILLAIIQGLIIDAFGELRDQLEQVKEDLESKCFICGIGKEYFDKVPHGFEKHVEKEHNFANYMFFLMHLINKPDTEYTGQETYVWELYQQRLWDFFPVGDCFRKQYEDQLSA